MVNVFMLMGIAEVILIVVILLYGAYDYIFNRRSSNELRPPKIGVWPYIGIGFELMNCPDVLNYYLIMHRIHGCVLRYQVFGLNVMSVCHPTDVWHVICDNFTNYEKGETMLRTFHSFLGNGIFSVNGDAWKKQRAETSHLFKKSNMSNMVTVIHEHLDTLCDVLQRHYYIDLQDFYMRFTMDTICVMAFNENPNSIKEPNRNFCKVFDWLQVETEQRAMNPFRKYMTQSNYNQALRDIDWHIKNIVSEANDERDKVINLMIAGRDTTAILLTWTTYLLNEHPECKRRFLEEINEFGDGRLTYDEYRKHIRSDNTSYILAVFQETLRLYPPVPENYKQAVYDDVLPHSGYAVPRGTEMHIPTYAIHRHPDFWGPDANEFNPDRWLQPDFRKNLRPGQYIPFHGGPRLCLGKDFALLEATLVATRLFRHFDFEPKPNQACEYQKGLTMPMRGGYLVKVVVKE